MFIYIHNTYMHIDLHMRPSEQLNKPSMDEDFSTWLNTVIGVLWSPMSWSCVATRNTRIR